MSKEILLFDFKVTMTDNTHAKDADGVVYEVASVLGGDWNGGESVYTKWTLPVGKTYTATLRKDGRIDLWM